MIRANMAEPLWRQVPRALGWMLNYLFTGTLFRVYRASLALRPGADCTSRCCWSAGSRSRPGRLAGRLADDAATRRAARVRVVIIGVAAALGCFMLLRPLADRLFVVQINSHWPYLLEYAARRAVVLRPPIEAGARRLVEIARANEADEIVVVGHSGGGVTAPAVVARALELDPELGRHGPRVVLLTPGSLMPGIGLHRSAPPGCTRHRRIAVEPIDPLDRRAGPRRRAELLRLRSGRRASASTPAPARAIR